MLEGIVKSFNDRKGYGFISIPTHPEDGDVFVHYTAILSEGHKTLIPGQKVTLEIAEGINGGQAVSVEVKKN